WDLDLGHTPSKRLKQLAAGPLPPKQLRGKTRGAPGLYPPGSSLVSHGRSGPLSCRRAQRVEGGRRTVVLARPPAVHSPPREAAPPRAPSIMDKPPHEFHDPNHGLVVTADTCVTVLGRTPERDLSDTPDAQLDTNKQR